ncbi:MAG: hypothetical protein AMJ92_09995 [candidate division Zixibacteria bacterium SM23_81]|nr:MAG: hypothetical protein AMJ92_09995 [candidate division Zixibacteria bacterium SM23_81]
MATRYIPIAVKIILGGLAVALFAMALFSGCGQKNPTQPLTGFIFVSSSIPGAAIFLDEEDSQQVTPDTLKDVPIGSHTVRVDLEGYVSSPQEVTVSVGQVVEAVFIMSSARVVLLEHFTSVNCMPCPATNEIINGLLETLGPEKVVGLEYHPWEGDPFYEAASFENITRNTYYGVSTIPVLFVDGVISPGSTDSLAMFAAVESRLAEPSPAIIAVTDTVTGSTWRGTARIIGLENVVSSDLRGFFVILEREIHLSQAPGINGEKDFYYVMREIRPQAHGEEGMNVAAGDTLYRLEETELQPGWNGEQILSVYFLQDYLSKEVLAAGSSMYAGLSR